MKAGNNHRLKGRSLSLTLVVLVITTIALWAWEKNHFANTLLLAQEWYIAPSSEFHVDARNDSVVSMKPTEKIVVNISDSIITKAEENFGTAPVDSISTLSPETIDRNEDMTSSSETKVCNYAKGRWVADSRRPLYSGLGCKKWLSAMWACRLTQRKDFSYEGYRWQPESCEMPEFERSAFLRRMQDKTIAFIGDSLGRQQFQSLMCMATGGEESPEVQNVGKKYGLVKARGAIRPDGWAYWFPKTNTTILYYWSASLSDLVPLNIVRWLDSHLPSYPHLKVFFRTISPRHFFNGDWKTGGTCDNTTPLSGGSEVMQDGSRRVRIIFVGNVALIMFSQ